AAGGAAAALANLRRALRRPGGVAAAAAAARFVDEGERHLDFAVPGKRLGARQVEGAPAAVDAVVAGPQGVGGVGQITQQELGTVHQHAAIALGGDGEAPQYRLRERVLHRLPLERIGAARSERQVRLHEQDLRADTLERDDAAAASGAAVEADVVGAEAGGEAEREEELGVEPRDLEEERAGS